MVKKWRKKPVIVEAMEFTDESKNRVVWWMGTENADTKIDENLKPVIVINTLEGKMMATVGDYIIKGIKGEFYPCKPDIFLATYEEVE